MSMTWKAAPQMGAPPPVPTGAPPLPSKPPEDISSDSSSMSDASSAEVSLGAVYESNDFPLPSGEASFVGHRPPTADGQKKSDEFSFTASDVISRAMLEASEEAKVDFPSDRRQDLPSGKLSSRTGILAKSGIRSSMVEKRNLRPCPHLLSAATCSPDDSSSKKGMNCR